MTAPIPPGYPQPEPKTGPRWWERRWLQLTIAGLIIFIIGGVIGGTGNKSSKNAAAVIPTPDPATITATMPVPGETATVSTTTTQTATATVTTTYTPVPMTAFDGDGTFLVGSQVQPGTYESDGPSQADGIGECSYSVNRQGSGIDAIITNGNSAGQTIIQIPSSAYTVMTQGCDPFHKV